MLCYFEYMTDKITSWGAIADWYDGLVEDTTDSYQKNVLMPNLIRLVDPKKGMTILDVACGQGYFARAFANNGAKVMACDISSELIKLADSHKSDKLIPLNKDGRGMSKTAVVAGKIEGKINRDTGQPNKGVVEYQVAPSDKLPFAADGSVDVVVIVLALQNIEKLAETIAECSRTLKVDGKLIIVLNHPAFRIPKSSAWRWDDEKVKSEISNLKNVVFDTKANGPKMFRRLDAYMSDAQIKVDMTPGEKVAAKKKFTVSFHRPLQSYFKAINKAGLAVTRLEEWISHKKSQDGPRGAEEDRMRKEIPMFLMLEARKG
jgi:ubiquinone/menaquinone biosynthesis C-methylase UbiE